MILIGEGGSTKTAWNLADMDSTKKLINTTGINPVLMTLVEIESSIRPLLSELEDQQIDSIYFFCAGCLSPMIKREVALVLSHVFECKEVHVESDLCGACIALCGRSEGIVAILGTGSNSCHWNGREVVEQTPSLGFILGDEGSGSYMGRQLISDYLKKKMPIDLQERFRSVYDISPEIAIQRTYRSPFPNRYLASFVPFISNNISHEYCRELVKSAFYVFLNRNVANYAQSSTLSVNFTGSIAFVFKRLLEEVCYEHGFRLGKIEKEPIDLLTANILRNR